MKSQCCNADIEIDKGGIGIFSLTTGAFICSSCRKYCVRSQIDFTEDELVDIDDPHCSCNNCREKRTINVAHP